MTERDATAERGARGRARLEPPDLSEKGGPKDGQPQRSNERLFMQFLAFGGCADALRSRATSSGRALRASSTKTSTIRAASRS